MYPTILAFDGTTLNLDSIITTLTGVLTDQQVYTTAAAIIGAAASLFLVYWGIRKATTVLTRAFSRGKIRF